MVHPVGLFHVPLAACGLTYPEIFALGHAESDEAVRAGEYTWELFEPLREGRTYDVGGEFTGVERKYGPARRRVRQGQLRPGADRRGVGAR